MKITKLIEKKDGSAVIEIEMDKKERDFMMELGVNEMIRVRLKMFEENLIKGEPPKQRKRGGVKKCKE